MGGEPGGSGGPHTRGQLRDSGQVRPAQGTERAWTHLLPSGARDQRNGVCLVTGGGQEGPGWGRRGRARTSEEQGSFCKAVRPRTSPLERQPRPRCVGSAPAPQPCRPRRAPAHLLHGQGHGAPVAGTSDPGGGQARGRTRGAAWQPGADPSPRAHRSARLANGRRCRIFLKPFCQRSALRVSIKPRSIKACYFRVFMKHKLKTGFRNCEGGSELF